MQLTPKFDCGPGEAGVRVVCGDSNRPAGAGRGRGRGIGGSLRQQRAGGGRERTGYWWFVDTAADRRDPGECGVMVVVRQQQTRGLRDGTKCWSW